MPHTHIGFNYWPADAPNTVHRGDGIAAVTVRNTGDTSLSLQHNDPAAFRLLADACVDAAEHLEHQAAVPTEVLS